MISQTKPLIGVTLGDPAGIGPEVALKAVGNPKILKAVRPVLLGPRMALEHYARRLRLARRLRVYSDLPEKVGGGEIAAIDTGNFDLPRIPFGRVHVECGRAALAAIRRGVALARAGALDALVTGPIHKKSAQLAGIVGAGHTEFIAHLCGARDARLMLVGPQLRIIHVSAHVSLKDALELIKRKRILRTIHLGVEIVRRLGIARPRVAVAGLNPHASDSGLFGDEEAREIAPAIVGAWRAGWRVEGPLPPDTVFHRAAQGEFDLVVALYHDQGHIAAKTLGFSDAVNVTAGLPIIRTSVDHGTAFDIAGKNRADGKNMRHAILLAGQMARQQARRRSRS
ncbi:MAG: 4-hydroxythreonine-4-phosphate dehydrogenase PdxA [Terriglobia bacterium]